MDAPAQEHPLEFSWVRFGVLAFIRWGWCMMEKRTLHSSDLIARNIERIAELFPNVMTEAQDAEGNVNPSIDFDLLRQELSDHVVEGPPERYQLDWPGKRAAAFAASAPIAKTLRPTRAESVDFDSTKNLFIEGDNLDALKLLQESYLGKVKLIYIDPPYNTGNDFVYADDFAESSLDYLIKSEQISDAGERLVANSESNGRFHSDWLSMMYSRLKLARNLLSDEGIICVSIDSNESHNLRKLGDEVFGAENFISDISVVANPRGRQSDSFVAGVHDYLLVWARKRVSAIVGGRPLDGQQKAEFGLRDDEIGFYRLLGLRQRGAASRRVDRPEMFFPIYVSPDGKRVSVTEVEGWHSVLPRKSDGTDGRWMWGRGKCSADIKRLVPKWIERRSEFDVFVKDPLIKQGSERLRKFKSIWDDRGFNNQNGTQEVKSLLGGDYMSFPKSVDLMREVLLLGAPQGGIVMDFFAGSSSMAHAVMKLNCEDGMNRNFVMVTLPESLVGTAAEEAGIGDISALSRERIRRAGAALRAENSLVSSVLDVGFRALYVDTGSFAEVLRSPENSNQDLLAELEASLKPERSGEDFLFQVLLDWGLELTVPIVREEIDECEVFAVDDDALLACFAETVHPSVVRVMAERAPLRAVFRDDAFESDAARINAEQIFKEISPTTEVRTI
ncbi:site-specific DNA-methyltransferase [Glutamicibacter arilaitensis]|uniref:site-specific DNA-methyltransferase n=1 Tax=Glutamicibacter arilaitensis TaxID=256701 RepID=UPI003FD26799